MEKFPSKSETVPFVLSDSSIIDAPTTGDSKESKTLPLITLTCECTECEPIRIISANKFLKRMFMFNCWFITIINLINLM